MASPPEAPLPADLLLDEPPAAAGVAAVGYPLDASAGHLLRRALQRHQALFQEQATGIGLTGPQFAALTKLAELHRVTQNRLGRLVAMDSATIQGVARRLALRGLLRTEPDPLDRRAVVLVITAEGERVVAEARLAGARANRALMAGLDVAEQVVLLGLLRRLTQ
jgi:MarR family transcriptional regulator, lower aerobic nicotinate degradation pathway regulator